MRVEPRFNKEDSIILQHYNQETFEKTNVVFSKTHYNIALSICKLPNNVGLIVVHNNKKDLVVAFNMATDRLSKEIGKELYRVIVKPPKNVNEKENS